MIDASDEVSDGGGEQTAADDDSPGCPVHSDLATSEGAAAEKYRLTNKEIVDISVGLLIAGYDTTSSTLSFTSYLLAVHPEIQEKLQSEIDSYFDEKPVSMHA